MLDFRPVLSLVGILLSVAGGLMFVPVFYDLLVPNAGNEWPVFAFSGVLTLFTGGLLYVANRQKKLSLSVRQAFFLTTITWFVMSLFCSLPFVFSSLEMPLARAFFEAASGLTTTGASALSSIQNLPPDILLWRGILHGIGGVGVIGVAIAVLPMLRVGGMQLFKMESSDKSDKLFPHHHQVALGVIFVYLGLNILCASFYAFFGMNGFDAVVHAMSTVGTGGFANYDSSFGQYVGNTPILWTGTLFMFAGGLPMLWYIALVRNPNMALGSNSQVRAYFYITVTLCLVAAVYGYQMTERPFTEMLTVASFSVVSMITTTGLSVEDYTLWGPLMTGLFFMMYFIGGCSGSTSGAIKVFRIQILWQVFRRQLRELVYPNGVHIARYEGRVISEDAVRSVLSFVFVYVLTFIMVGLALQMTGLDFITAFSGSAMAIGNHGVGLGSIIGPSGGAAGLPDDALWLLSAAMVIGRLEIFTVFVMFTPTFWRA